MQPDVISKYVSMLFGGKKGLYLELLSYMELYFCAIHYNLNGSKMDGSLTVDDSNSFFQSLQNPSNSSRKQIFRDFFLFYCGIVCCVCSLESPHRGDSDEYTQHTIIA